MDYRGYHIQYSDFGVIVRDSKGKFIIEVVSESEAEEWIDAMLDNLTDMYKPFSLYCKKLPGRCFMEDKLATTSKQALNRFIEGFKKKEENIEIITHSEYWGGEEFYVVDSVTKL
jgi:hypothetical protein